MSTTATASGSTSAAPATTAARATTAKVTAATRTATRTATAAPRQTAYVEDPTATAGMDFGILNQVEQTASGYTITVDRASFVTGAKAQAYYAQHPDEEPLDYAVVNTNPKLRTFALTKDAVVYAQFALGDGDGVKTQPITADQFYEKAVGIVSTGGQPAAVAAAHAGPRRSRLLPRRAVHALTAVTARRRTAPLPGRGAAPSAWCCGLPDDLRRRARP